MKLASFIFFAFLAMAPTSGHCEDVRNYSDKDDLSTLREKFTKAIFSSEVEEGPFHMHYDLQTVFFSKELASLFGSIFLYDCMPHGWHLYEAKTYVKTGEVFSEITLNDLFPTQSEQEFLRSYCEDALKKDRQTYFGGENPLKDHLDSKDIQTFVINDQFLIIIFQPGVAVSSCEAPCVVKIPFNDIVGHCDSHHMLLPLLQKIVASGEFTSDVDREYF